MKPSTINTIFRKLSDSIPKPQTELLHRNPFELLVSVILSAQATDVSVNKVTPELFAKFPTPEKMHSAGAEKIFSYIKSIGLAPTKSKNIASTCGQLVRYHQGKVPKSREELEQLPGVGRKTANVILNTAFGEPVIAVDTHVLGFPTVLDLQTVIPCWKLRKNLCRLFLQNGKRMLTIYSSCKDVMSASHVILTVRIV